jgi:hypothetical protein
VGSRRLLGVGGLHAVAHDLAVLPHTIAALGSAPSIGSWTTPLYVTVAPCLKFAWFLGEVIDTFGGAT